MAKCWEGSWALKGAKTERMGGVAQGRDEGSAGIGIEALPLLGRGGG